MKHSAWLQNCTPTHALNEKTPYEMQHGKKPYLAGILEFGTMVYVKDLGAGKLDPKAHDGMFMDHNSESKAEVTKSIGPNRSQYQLNRMWYSM